MSRLIDAEKIDFNEVFGGQSDFAKDTRGAAQSLIDAQPTVEAVPVVHGEWVNEYINRYGHPCHCCSVCGFHASHQDKNFCPECGSDMRKKVQYEQI